MPETETADHLFFKCVVSRVVWRVVGSLFNTSYIPTSLWQFYTWMYAFLPGGERFYSTGLAAMVWAIWNM